MTLFILGVSLTVNVALVVFAMWQHNIIAECAKERGIEL